MKYLIVLLIAVLISMLAGAILVSVSVIMSGDDRKDTEQEDLEQEQYLREWREKKERKKKKNRPV